MDSMSIFIAAMLIMIDLMIEHFHSEQSFFIDDEEYLENFFVAHKQYMSGDYIHVTFEEWCRMNLEKVKKVA